MIFYKIFTYSLSIGILLASTTPLFANTVTIASVKQYKKLYSSKKPLITFYSASWCTPCKNMKPHFIKAAQKFPDMTFCLIDIDKRSLKELCTTIKSIPTLTFSYNGAVIEQTGSLSRFDLDDKCVKLQSKAAASQQNSSSKKRLPLKK
jgi:thioredoxin 1